MSYQIHVYDKKKTRLEEAPECPDDLDDATAVARGLCATQEEGFEVHLVADTGGGQKWLLGFTKKDGTTQRIR